MINKIDNSQHQVQFGALKINKPFKEWNNDVLTATLNSRVIRNIIAKDAKEGKDTFISFDTDKIENWNFTTNSMLLNVKGAGKDLIFKAKSITYYVKTGLFGTGERQALETGSKNLGKDVADQIKSLDIETFSRKNAIEEIENLTGKIEVTEKEVGTDFEA